MIKKFLTLTATVEVALDENDEVRTIEEAKELSETAAEAIEYLEDLGWKLELKHLETKDELNERLEYEKENKVFRAKDVRTIVVESGVRYWEDADVNGEPDDEDEPRIPCVDGENWKIEIDTKTGKIRNWEKGVTADVHYKTCDDNKITLKNEYGDVLGEYNCYVPDFLCIGESGYGDYIIMEIEADGKIVDFRFDDDDIETLKDSAF